MNRREVLGGGVVSGLLGATDLSARVSNPLNDCAPSLTASVSVGDVTYHYPNGPTIPSYFVTFRDDGRVVFHLGALGNLNAPGPTVKPYHLGPHHVRIEHDGKTVFDANIPVHYWGSEWTYRPAPLSVTRTPAQIFAANRMFVFGDTGNRLGVPTNYEFKGPMDNAGVTKYMGTTGERADIGLVTEPSGHYLLGGSPGPMLAWAQAAGSCPLHFRDETTGRPIDLLKYPQANCYDTPGSQGAPWLDKGPPIPKTATEEGSNGYHVWGGGWGPQQAHFCEMSYVAYLATGDLGLLEDLQYEANFVVLADATKSTRAGAIISGEYRGLAWALRQLFMAHVATKDLEDQGRPLPPGLHPSSYFKRLLDNSLAYYGPIMNSKEPIVQMYRLMVHTTRFGPWQADYLLSALGFGVLSGHADWAPLYLWCLGNVVARTSGKSGYPPGWGGAYYLNLYPWVKNPDGTYNQGAYDMSQPLDWYGTFLFQQNDPNSARPSPAQIAALKNDPYNGYRPMVGGEYLLTTRAVLVEAAYLESKGLVNVRAAYPDLDACISNVDRMVRGGGMSARVSVVVPGVKR